MSSSFSKYVLLQEIKSVHAAKLFDYTEKYHLEIANFLKNDLSKAFNKFINSIDKKIKPDEDILEKYRLEDKNSNALSVDITSTKLLSNRFINQKDSTVNLYISHAYDKSDRQYIINNALSIGQTVLENSILKFKQIFHIEKPSGNTESVFNVAYHDNEVKLQFSSKSGTEHTLKTIFIIGVEFGKENSKSKNFDRIFFIDLLK